MSRLPLSCLLLLPMLPLHAEPASGVDFVPGLWRTQLATDDGVSVYQCFDSYHWMWDKNACKAQTGELSKSQGRERRFSTRLERRDWIEDRSYRSVSKCITEVVSPGLPKYEHSVALTESVWRGDFSRKVVKDTKTTVTMRDVPLPTSVDSRSTLDLLGRCPASLQPGTACKITRVDLKRSVSAFPPCDERTAVEIRRLESELAGGGSSGR